MRFQGDDDNEPGSFAFHQTVFQEKISKLVTDYCHNSTSKELELVLLLDSGSTVDLIQDSRMLRDIKRSDKICHINTNGGVLSTNLTGVLPGYG